MKKINDSQTDNASAQTKTRRTAKQTDAEAKRHAYLDKYRDLDNIVIGLMMRNITK